MEFAPPHPPSSSRSRLGDCQDGVVIAQSSPDESVVVPMSRQLRVRASYSLVLRDVLRREEGREIRDNLLKNIHPD